MKSTTKYHQLQALLLWYKALGIETSCESTAINRFVPVRGNFDQSPGLSDQVRPDDHSPDPEPNPRSISPLKTNLINKINNDIDRIDNIEKLQEYISQIKALSLQKTAAHTLHQSYGTSVDGTPRTLILRAMPSREEDISGKGYSDNHATLARNIIKATGQGESYDALYLSPWRSPGQRSLTDEETAVCHRLMIKRLSLIKPKHILAFGLPTIRGLLHRPELKPSDIGGCFEIPLEQGNSHKVSVFALFSLESLINNIQLKRKCWGHIVNWRKSGLL